MEPEPESEPELEPEPEHEPQAGKPDAQSQQLAPLTRSISSQNVRAAVLGEVGRLPDSAMRELHRLLHNAQDFEAKSSRGTRTDYLRSLGTKDNATFEVLPHALDRAKTFDILMFRGTDFVSDTIARISKTRGADHFSHVGMVIKPPLVPRHGRYLRSGAIDDTGEFGNLPFVNLRMKIVREAGERLLRVTVVRCVRLPERLDEGSLKEDPYVRLVLEPWGDALVNRAREQYGPEFTDQGVKRGNPVHTHFITQSGPSPEFNFEADIPFPEACETSGGYVAKPKLRIEVWDKDWLSPDDLMAEASFPMDSPTFLEPMYTEAGFDAWIRLDVVDAEVADRGLRSFITLPQVHSVSKSDPETAPAQDGADDVRPAPEYIKGHLLMAPLGRKYKKLYDTEDLHMACRTRTYKTLFTWRYFSLLCILVAWSLVNYLGFLIMFHQTHGSVRWRFNKTAELSEADLADCSEESLNVDECELHNWWFTNYMQAADWIITGCFCLDIVLRLYCLRWRQWASIKWNWIDLLVTAFDVVAVVLQYRRQATVASVQVMRPLRFVRAASIVAMFHRIRKYKKHKWILHEVTVNVVGDDLQVSMDGQLKDDDDKTVIGPYIIDHRIDPHASDDHSPVPTSEASPARVLDRGRHIKYLRHQSENCLLVPVVDASKNAIYLQFDALQSDIRDMWINEINTLYRKRARKEPDGTVETVDHHLWQRKNSFRQRRLEREQSAAHSTSQDVVAEFQLKEYDPQTGQPIPYIWESAVSGTIAGFYNTSDVLDEESHRGALGVQIRPLREVLADYDGEICMLRLKANWKGETIDWNDPHVAEFLQQQITRVHELYYRRSYTCNCFLCLATLFPKCAPCAKWMSRFCGFCCCGTISAFREDSVKCSQLVANIYQAVGLMDPRVNPSLVMPVDFLPPELLQQQDNVNENEHAALEFDDNRSDLAATGTGDKPPRMKRGASAPQLHTTHMGMQFHKEERSSICSSRDHLAMHDEDHPHHERHKELAEEGYGNSDVSDSEAREASIKAFFDGLPKFDADVIPLKVRKVGAKFAQENAEEARHRWTAAMQQEDADELKRLSEHVGELDQSSQAVDINHHKIVLDLLGPLLEKINVGADDIDGASLSELADKVSQGIIGTTLAAGMQMGAGPEEHDLTESIEAERRRRRSRKHRSETSEETQSGHRP